MYYSTVYTSLFIIFCIYAKRIQAAPFGNVAFSAGITTQLSLPANNTVVYDRVWLNIGDAYDNTTGIFTCPKAGTYVFFFHGLTQSAGTLWLELYRNGQYEMSGYAHNTGDYAYAGNSAVLTLANGDTVAIQDQGTVDLFGATDEIYSTFSGYLLSSHS